MRRRFDVQIRSRTVKQCRLIPIHSYWGAADIGQERIRNRCSFSRCIRGNGLSKDLLSQRPQINSILRFSLGKNCNHNMNTTGLFSFHYHPSKRLSWKLCAANHCIVARS